MKNIAASITTTILISASMHVSASFCNTASPKNISMCEDYLNNSKNHSLSESWAIFTKEDELTDEITTLALNVSEKSASVGVLGKEPMLGVSCKPGEIYVYFNAGFPLDGSREVHYRFDKKKSIKDQWDELSSGLLVPDNAVDFIKEIRNSERLIIQTTSFLDDLITARFNLIGFEGVEEKLPCLNAE